MQQILLSALYAIARQIAGSMLPRLVTLILDAQQQFGKGTGTEKKAWLIERIHKEALFGRSLLINLAPVALSAVLDVIVAWVKTSRPVQ